MLPKDSTDRELLSWVKNPANGYYGAYYWQIFYIYMQEKRHGLRKVDTANLLNFRENEPIF